MGAGKGDMALYPTARLLVVIGTDGSVVMLQPRLTTPRPLTVQELNLIAALSTGQIADNEQGLASYMDAAGFNEQQRESATKLTRQMLRRDRLEIRATAEIANEPMVPALEPGAYSGEISEGPLVLRTPCTFRLRGGAFEAVSHDGTRLPPISAVQLLALSQLVEHSLIPDALRAHQESAGDAALDKAQYMALLGPFAAHRFVVPRVARASSGADLSGAILSGGSAEETRRMFRLNAVVQDEAEAARVAAGGRKRPKVIPVAFDMCPPAGLGAVIAYAKVHEGGALDEFYDFRTDWVWDPDRLERFTAEPAIYLFTNYLWSHLECIQVCEQIKALSPDSITIHGGPDTPKYEGDQQRYFAENPQVDVIVRGEGEIVGAEALSKLREVIGNSNPDLSVLDGVNGVTYRGREGVVRNPDQARIKDLDVLPSAYLTGLFDNYIGLEDLFVILETNRGCPYGCTFCDWGSATASKIRKFSMEQVMAEIEWTSRAKVASVSIADANFGIFERDVEIARKAAELKNGSGFPRGFGGNYAKNTVKYLREIIEVLAAGNILTLGTLSLQSMDENTLDVIDRSNIKTEKYDAIAVEMRNSELPLTVELMMGLPGSTTASFREDLQQCIDRELPARVNMTTLLVNSPMNDPDYMAEHQIKTKLPIAPGNLAVLSSTATYDEADLTQMYELRNIYLLFENFGVLRILSRFVRQETELDEMGFYQKLLLDSRDHRSWPMLHILINFVPALMAPPVSWSLVFAELGRYLVDELGLEDNPALHSILAAQLACIPAHDRVHPESQQLQRDVVAWHLAIVDEKEQGNRRGWTNVVPRLDTFGPGTLTVDDPFGLTEASLGVNRELNAFGVNWELNSPLHRARSDLA